jgi:hypothetical protein
MGRVVRISHVGVTVWRLRSQTENNMRGRTLEPMEGAGETYVTAKPHWWAVESNVLQVPTSFLASA